MGLEACPMLKECCCGCSLNTGSMVIGYISLISALILAGVTAANLNTNYSLFEKNIFEAVIQSIVVIVNTLIAVVSLLLIIGIHMKQSVYMMPWLIAALVTVPIDSISLCIMLGNLAVGVFNPKVYGLFTHISITVYFFFVVYSYYRELKTQPAKPV